MTPITVHPDPQEPAGGYAFLELPEGTLSEDSARVALFDPFSERWLGEGGGPEGRWQTPRHDFGPFAVHRHEGAEWVRIGPEVVNHLEAYAPLSIEVGSHRGEVIWPDSVRPRARAAVMGALKPVARHRPTLLQDRPVAPPPAAPPVPDPLPANPPPEIEPAGTPATQSRRWLWFLVLLVILAAGAVFWVMLGANDESEPDSTAAADRCSLSALRSLDGGFAAIESGIRDCGADVSPETALSLIEEAADGDDPAALFLFGTLYDGTRLDPRIENLIGLTFDDDPAQAAEYYSRAVQAGSADAEVRLEAICETLPDRDTTLAKGAHDDYCQ